LGWHVQGDGRWYLGLHVENGRIKDTESVQLRTGLRRAIEQFRPGVRLTPQQNILLTDVPVSQRAPLTALLTRYGIPTDPTQVGTHRFAMACPALPTCGLALAEAERVLPDIVRQIEADLHSLGLAHEPVSIRMTGCPNGCARPFMGDIGFVGRTKDVYNVYVGGDRQNTRMNTLYAPMVRLEHLAATLRPLLALWKEERVAEEGFGDYCNRVGVDYLRSQAEIPALNGSVAHQKSQVEVGP
jgi:sulfite reductase (ferredoxin)